MNGDPYEAYASVDAFQRYSVNRPGQLEVVKQPLYDYQTYPAAGATQLTFFAIPKGQSGKTLADTNMEVAGSLPNPKKFLVLGIEVFFIPGPNPSAAAAAPGVDNFVNDVWTVFKSTGYLEFFIGSKAYLDAPINMFPAVTRLAGFAGLADSTTAGANQFTRTSYASSAGQPFGLKPPLMLEPTQNFTITLNFPTAVAISANGRIGVHLKGLLYRNSQ